MKKVKIEITRTGRVEVFYGKNSVGSGQVNIDRMPVLRSFLRARDSFTIPVSVGSGRITAYITGVSSTVLNGLRHIAGVVR